MNSPKLNRTKPFNTDSVNELLSEILCNNDDEPSFESLLNVIESLTNIIETLNNRIERCKYEIKQTNKRISSLYDSDHDHCICNDICQCKH